MNVPVDFDVVKSNEDKSSHVKETAIASITELHNQLLEAKQANISQADGYRRVVENLTAKIQLMEAKLSVAPDIQKIAMTARNYVAMRMVAMRDAPTIDQLQSDLDYLDSFLDAS